VRHIVALEDAPDCRGIQPEIVRDRDDAATTALPRGPHRLFDLVARAVRHALRAGGNLSVHDT
jgi:hypothetical protein